MKIIILADGKETRWNKHLGVRKCEIVIDGERLIERTVRLLKENGATDIIIVGDIKVDGARNDKFPNCTRKVMAFLEIVKKYQDEVIFLFGDCFYTQEIIIDCLTRKVDKYGHWVNPTVNNFTGKRYGEGYIHKVSDYKWWIHKIQEFFLEIQNGNIQYRSDWVFNRFLYDWEDLYTHKKDTLGKYDVYWNDETDDIDYPEDYERFMKYTGRA